MIAIRRLLWVVIALVVVQYVVGAAVFVAYPDSALRSRADAVVVLAGSDTRLPVARQLMKVRAAKTLVVSDDTAEGTDPDRAAFCGQAAHPYPVICRRPDPFSTRGEARLTAGLARAETWRTIVVVTSRYHLLRTRILFRRCTDATLVLRGAREPWPGLLLAIPLEWVKLAVAETVRRGC